jgi:hypothetical protein
MRSPSTFSSAGVERVADRDDQLIRFGRSLVDAARREWGDKLIAEGNGTFDPRLLYTETHYALAAVLLYLHDRKDGSLLDLAESRLRLWATGPVPLTFFNAMAICLAAVVLRRAGAEHAGLQSVLDELLGNTREHRHVAYDQWCGNNAYLQQVAVDTVLLPVARGGEVTAEGLDLLFKEFRSFRTPEGLFFDLPRNGTDHERLAPPTYIMKMLFLLGICHQLHPSPEFEDLFLAGMAAVLPLLSRDGNFSYFGRTDNSPFAAGLTIFNLRKAAQSSPGRAPEYQDACARTEQFYQSFPRTRSGVLDANRFGDATSAAETWYSKDAYAYVAQYSLSSCAYALLGCHWHPVEAGPQIHDAQPASAAISNDLGIVRAGDRDRELIVRTRSEMTSWDRRYLGPTILRYSVGDRLLVGAISRTVSTDRSARRQPSNSRVRRLFERLRSRYEDGVEQLDVTSIGFLPALRQRAVDYVPYIPLSVDASSTHVATRHQMLRVNVRGLHPCWIEALQLIRGALPGIEPKRYVAPRMKPAPALELWRSIVLEPETCRIEDRLTGDLAGKELLFSVRRLPGVSIRVDGLTRLRSITGWGSDGRQTLDIYGARQLPGSEMRYECRIEEER